jgi:hypothetical protein
MKRIQIHLEEDLDDAAEREAKRRGISKAALIRGSLARELSPEPVDSVDPWARMCGWLDDEPIENIDEFLYGASRQ